MILPPQFVHVFANTFIIRFDAMIRPYLFHILKTFTGLPRCTSAFSWYYGCNWYLAPDFLYHTSKSSTGQYKFKSWHSL